MKICFPFFRFIGKMNPGHGVCYVPKNNKETPVSNYELLVAFTDSPGKVSTTTPRSVFVTSPVSKFYTPIFAQPLKSANKTSGKLEKYLFLLGRALNFCSTSFQIQFLLCLRGSFTIKSAFLL